jgi:hypothetical protein
MANVTDWLIILLAAPVLLVAGLGKLVAPDNLAAALSEVLGRPFRPAHVRAAASAEVLAAVCLTIPPARVAASLVVGVLGLCFAYAGLAGWRRGSTMACGCVGSKGTRPLGPLNMAIGAAFLLVPASVLVREIELTAADSLYGLAAASLALCLLLNRSLIRDFTKPVPDRGGTP